MRTEPDTAGSMALFLFAHQDDEFGVFQSIADEVAAGHRVVCAYLTNGRCRGVEPAERNAESLAVLGDLGIAAADVHFAGEALGIDDASLPDNTLRAAGWLRSWLAGFPRPARIYVPAWEGGHHDHDTLHAIAVTVASQLGLATSVRQFALYNAWRCPKPFFRVLKPLEGNGPVDHSTIPWGNRIRFLRYVLTYRSQWKTWIGLLPFVVLRYLFDGRQCTQRADRSRIAMRPHEGKLLYEARGVYRWETMQAKLAVLAPPLAAAN